jgi:meso-butanediol dehydrogenase / (S,S)-butanediol dehydrogenase / diacetyl reductase
VAVRLAGKTALVIGAGGGIGSSTPYLFAREGANVVLTGRRPAPLEELADRIRPLLGIGAGELDTALGDATTAVGNDEVVQATLERFGRIDILFCNVGDAAFADRRIEDLDDQAWRYLVDVNLTSNFAPLRAALPELKKSRGNAIFVSASPNVRRQASPGYAAAKQALLALTTSLAHRLRDDGVRVNCICPGAIGGSQGDSDFTELPAILNRSGRGADVGYAALYLASDEAAWVTGQFIDVDGGDSL